MSKSGGLGDRLYVDGVDLSGDAATVSELSGGPALFDTTPITADAARRAGSLVSGVIRVTAFHNPARAHPALAPRPLSDRVLTYLHGAVAQCPAAGLLAKQVNYDPRRDTNGALLLGVEALSTGTPLEWGQDYVGAAQRTDTTATNGPGVDDGAATTGGLTAYLHVFALTGTSATVTVQHSLDNGATDPWTTLITFTAVTTAPTAARETATGLVKRWIRVVTTGTFTNLALHLMGVRISGAAVAVDVQIFTSSGTWTKPTGVTAVWVGLIAGGGGGGSGARRASGTATSGGGGGAGGGMSTITFRSTELGATETVTVGAGGAGGAARTTNDTNGANGTPGGASRFGTTVLVTARATAPGGGGSLGAVAETVVPRAMFPGGTGAASNNGSNGNNGSHGLGGAAGGGAGGGIDTAPTAFTGGTGGSSTMLNDVGTGAAGTVGVNGGNATPAPANTVTGGPGGGGGGASTTGVGGNGGNGGLYGGGGGGGGSSLNGNNSGAGGSGASGLVVVVSW